MIGWLTLFMTGFWMLMIFECIRNESEKLPWLLLIIFLSFPGAVIYFLVRRLPQLNLPVFNIFKRWTYHQKLWSAEAGVKNIGKAYQYIVLGDVYYEMGALEKADNTYEQALQKEPNNPYAIWGKVLIEMKHKQFERAQENLQTLLKLDPNFKYGEASLAYGKTLVALDKWEAAKTHLETDIKLWSHPESYLMLATIFIQQGQSEKAKEYLEVMIAKVKASPKFHYRRHQQTLKKAEKLLKTI